ESAVGRTASKPGPDRDHFMQVNADGRYIVRTPDDLVGLDAQIVRQLAGNGDARRHKRKRVAFHRLQRVAPANRVKAGFDIVVSIAAFTGYGKADVDFRVGKDNHG